MNTIIIDATKHTPEVIFDVKNKTLSLIGKSLPDDSSEFFGKINNILNDFLMEINNDLKIVCYLTYINSSSSRYIYDIFKKCSEIMCHLDIIWKYNIDDDMKEQGEEYEMALNMRIRFTYEVI